MSARELVVLGTSSQVPTRYRNHNGYLLCWDAHGFLFDPGEGTQRQMAFADVTVQQVTKICMTHFHGDHCLGLAGLIQRIHLERLSHEVEIYFPKSGRKYYDRLQEASIFEAHSSLVARPIAAAGPQWSDDTLTLSVERLDHGRVETFGYRLQEPDGVALLPDALEARGVGEAMWPELFREGEIQVDGQRVRLEDVSAPRPGQSMAFVMDTRVCDGAFKLAEGVDLLVCESTYLSSESREARAHGHMTARQAARVAKEAGARRLVLSHFSQRYGSTKPFVAEARELFDDVIAVRDGDRVRVPERIVPAAAL